MRPHMPLVPSTTRTSFSLCQGCVHETAAGEQLTRGKEQPVTAGHLPEFSGGGTEGRHGGQCVLQSREWSSDGVVE